MELIIVILISAIVVWKNIYTIILIKNFIKEKNTKYICINCMFLINYAIYYYFLYIAAAGKIVSPLEEPLWIIILFIILTCGNIYYDLKHSKIE